MKKITLSIITMLMVLSIKAQNTGVVELENREFISKNNIKFSPINALVGEISLSYERVIHPKRTLNFTLSQAYTKSNLVTNERGFMSEYNVLLESEIRFYLLKAKKAPQGWFAGVGVLKFYDYLKYKDIILKIDKTIEVFGTGGLVMTGYQWVFIQSLKGFIIEVAGGIDSRISISKVKYRDEIVNPRLKFLIGYSW